MTYYPTIPQSGQTLGNSRPQVQGNFNLIQQTISQDHIPIGSAGQGKHNRCTYPIQTQSPATATGECDLYSRTLNSVPQLCIQKQNQLAGAADIQMTRLDTGASYNTNGWTFWPGGVIFQWGQGAFVGTNASVVINFADANINFISGCANIQVTGIGFNNTFDVTNISTTHFTVTRSLGTLGANQNFYWTAIGA